jgi:hypothetical protein
MALHLVRVRARPMEIAAAYPYNEHVPRGYELFSVAAPVACHLLQEGFAADKRPEARLRQCFIQGLPTKYGPSRLRVAAVRPLGEWLAVDSNGWPIAPEPVVIDWPHPDAGPGMGATMPEAGFVWPSSTPPLIADESLELVDIPPLNADWSWIMWFGASVDGYAEFGSPKNLGALANTARAYWDRTNELPPLDLRSLRACLFFECRRHHHYGHVPDAETTPYIRALVERTREAVAKLVSPP